MVEIKVHRRIVELLIEKKGMRLAELVCQMHLEFGLLRGEVESIVDNMLLNGHINGFRFTHETFDREYSFLIPITYRVLD